MHRQRAESPCRIDGIEAATRFFAAKVAQCDPATERLWVAHLDPAGECLHVSAHDGDADGADMPVRSIVLNAATFGTAAILLAHNHPSGDPSPSATNVRATRRLAVVVDALGCRIADHLVFGGGHCTSFRRAGYL